MSRRVYRAYAIWVALSLLLWGVLPAYAQSPRPATDGSGRAPAPLVDTVVVFSQPPRPEGGLRQSSLRDPDGSDSDQWAWDRFVLGWDQDITAVQWRGGYDPIRLGSGGPVAGFTVAIYGSIPSGTQPDLARPPLVRYEVRGNAGETPSAVLGGVQTYDYQYVLPHPFQVAAQVKYWVQIEAYQPGSPDWGLSAANGGDGVYFRRIAGEGTNYQVVSGDTAFSLWGPLAVTPTATIAPTISAHKVLLPVIWK